MPIKFKLRIPPGKLAEYAKKYSYPGEEDVEALVPMVKKAGRLTKPQLQQVCYWKTPRSARWVAKNPEDLVKEITGFVLTAKSEPARIQTLTVLSGVSWPTASVILHFFHRDPYPILDYRALWSLGVEQPGQYKFEFWWAYVEYWRKLRDRCGLDKRELDRALWQYSKDKQR